MSATNSSITMKEVPTNIEIKVPPKSRKYYKSLILDNGLKVLVISDPQTEVSTVAMTVRVGSSSDPQNAQGLTHLLEHMIFTGSARYPKPNEIHEFLSHHGGDSNAVTEMDYTLFHLMVNNNDDFEDALKRFCDPFISPLFKEDCIENEINAVEHEFESIRQTDKSRLDQLKGHTAPPGHPFKRFTWGNRKSLTMLKKNKLLSLLRDHLNKFYVGCAMNLVLLGQDSLEVLQELVMDCFRRLKHGSETISSYISSEHPVWKKHTMYLSNSAEDIHLLDITWSVPPKKTPLQFLLIVLNHKCEGSLYSLFKKKGWLISLKASFGDYKLDSEDDDPNGAYSCTSVGILFSVSLELTNLGRKEVYDIIGFVYQYLNFLRGNEADWIMEEYFLIKRLKFQYFDDYDLGSDPYALTKQLAVNMIYLPLEDVVCADYTTERCHKEEIEDVLKHFHPSSMRLDLASKSFDEKEEYLIEPYFNTFYKEMEISSDLVEKWQDPEVCWTFQFPPKNKFLPTVHFSSGDDEDEKADEDEETDEDADEEEADEDADEDEAEDEDEEADEDDVLVLVEKPHIRLFHIHEEGSIPTFNFSVYCNIGNDLVSQVHGAIYLQLLKDSLDSILSQGKEANLITSITLSDRNRFDIKTSGFKERLYIYVSMIWDVFTSFSPSPDCFMTDKEIVEYGLKSNIAELYDHSMSLMQEQLSSSSYSVDSMLKTLNLVEFEDMICFITDLRSKMFIEGVFFGDILRDEALYISKLFLSNQIVPLPEESRHDERNNISRSKDTTPFDDLVSIKSDINSLGMVCFQIGKETDDARNTALLHLFFSLVEENISYCLRTKKNLGYDVEGKLHFKYGIKLLTIRVVSSVHDPDFLLMHIYDYVKGLEEFLEGMDSDVFENHKETILGEYSGGGENMWDLLTERRCFPDFNKRVKQQLRDIDLKHVIKFYRNYLTKASSKTRMLSVRIWGCNSTRMLW